MHGKGGEGFDIGSQLVSTSTCEILPSIISRPLIYLLCLFALSVAHYLLQTTARSNLVPAAHRMGYLSNLSRLLPFSPAA